MKWRRRASPATSGGHAEVPVDVRDNVSAIVGSRLDGMVQTVAGNPGRYLIPVSTTTAETLARGPVAGNPTLLCTWTGEDWIVTLGDGGDLVDGVWRDSDGVKASWTRAVDERAMATIVSLLGVLGFGDAREIRERTTKYESITGVFRHTLSTPRGDVRVHTRRLSIDPPVTEFVVETVRPPRFQLGRVENGWFDEADIVEVESCPF